MSIDEIVAECKRLGISYENYVAKYLPPPKSIVKSPPRSIRGTVATKHICPVCGIEFYSFKQKAIYCSQECRQYMSYQNKKG